MGEAKRRRALAQQFGQDVLVSMQSIGIPASDLSDPDKITLAGITLALPGIGTAVRGMLEDLTVRVFDAHGLEAFACSKRAAAIHEAGHVVIYAAHGAEVESAHIEETPAKTGWIGYTSSVGTAFTVKDGQGESEDLYRNRARFLIAGVTAEKLFDPEAKAGSSLDEWVMAQVMACKAAMLAGRKDDTRYFNDEVYRTAGLILLRHEETCREIARHLFDHGSLNGAKLAACCGRISQRWR
jgi:hypothetical protein